MSRPKKNSGYIPMTRGDRARYKRDKRLENKANHLCSVCGSALPDGYEFVSCTMCLSRCAIASRKNGRKIVSGGMTNDVSRQRAVRLDRKTNSLCYDCGSRIETVGRSRCDSCFLIKQAGDRAFRQYRKDNGLCVRCGSSDIVTPGNASRCIDCYFRDTAKKVVIRTGKDIDWKEIKRIWLDQDGLCAITGFRLTPGLDAELDHIVPVSRCSDPNSADNLRWVYYRVNHAKYDMTDNEFVEFVDDLHRCLHKNDSVK